MEKMNREELMGKMSLPMEELAKVVGGGDPKGEMRFYDLIEKKLDIPRSSIPPGSTFGKFGSGSLDIVDFIREVEDEFGIDK